MEDINRDGIVTYHDLNIILNKWENNNSNILENLKSKWGEKQKSLIVIVPLIKTFSFL